MRLFVALNFNDDTRARLVALAGNLVGELGPRGGGSFVPQENLHLTLAFLGECGAAQVSAAKAALDAVEFGPIDVMFGLVGRFRREGGDVWWVGVDESVSLMDLQRNLANALAANGFAPDGRRFRPHVTLARRVPAEPVPWSLEPFGETVRRMELMESKHVEDRLTYTSLRSKNASWFSTGELTALAPSGPTCSSSPDPEREGRNEFALRLLQRLGNLVLA
jgi:2'-5' RNA ligase